MPDGLAGSENPLQESGRIVAENRIQFSIEAGPADLFKRAIPAHQAAFSVDQGKTFRERIEGRLPLLGRFPGYALRRSQPQQRPHGSDQDHGFDRVSQIAVRSSLQRTGAILTGDERSGDLQNGYLRCERILFDPPAHFVSRNIGQAHVQDEEIRKRLCHFQGFSPSADFRAVKPRLAKNAAQHIAILYSVIYDKYAGMILRHSVLD